MIYQALASCERELCMHTWLTTRLMWHSTNDLVCRCAYLHLDPPTYLLSCVRGGSSILCMTVIWTLYTILLRFFRCRHA